jgi:hypothetical protein
MISFLGACVAARRCYVSAVKPKGHQTDPKEQHWPQDVIRLASHAVSPMPPSTTARRGVAQQIAASAAPIAPVVIRERSVMRDQLLSDEG